MNLQVVSFNSKNSTVAERETALAFLSGQAGVLLATCNRVELYQMTNDKCQMSNEGVKYLFRVAAGLESQILGETEILGQVSAAALKARGTRLEEVFSKAVEVGARVRNETGISRGNVSLASVAVAKATSLLKGKDKKVVLIGCGKVSQAVLKNLIKRGFSCVIVANKTFAKAKELAKDIGGLAVQFDCLAREIKDADLVISSTAAPHLILRKRQVGKRAKPLVIMDLASPRDIEPEIGRLSQVSLFNIDDIKEEINLNLLKRKIEAIKAEKIVETEVEKFCARFALAVAAVN